MKPAVIEASERAYNWLLRFYPARFKQEFGTEMQFVFSEALKDSYSQHRARGLFRLWGRTVLDAAKTIIVEQFEKEKGVSMETMAKKTSAWLPLAMSLAALALLIGYVLVVGIVGSPDGDEGAPARIFQLLLAGQLPIMAFFAVKWLPEQPRQAWKILALQLGAIVLAVSLVLYFEM